MQISVVNLDSKLSTLEILAVIRAVNIQIERDFAPYWHMSARLRLDSQDPNVDPEDLGGLRGDAVIYIADEPSEDYLGYHETHASGVPFGFVFRSLSKEIDEDWSVTMSHEALELLADPYCNLLCKGRHPDPREHGRHVFHWFEMCDAVQGETYEINGVKVSNFVLPTYFTGGEEMDGRNDFLATASNDGKQLRSFDVNEGGYVGFYDPERGADDTWEPSSKAKHRQGVKSKLAGNLFRRADRREQAHPITPARQRAGLPSHIEAVEAIWLRVDEPVEWSYFEQCIAMHAPAEFSLIALAQKGEYLITGKLLESQLGELWTLVYALRSKEWVMDCDLMLVARTHEEDQQKVRRASASGHRTCACTPADVPDGLGERWALDMINVPKAWDLLQKSRPGEHPGTRVIIAHPDTGYTSYLKSSGRILRGGNDFTIRDSDGVDPLQVVGNSGHGTRTGAVIVAPLGDDRMDGVAPGAGLIPYRIGGTVFVLSGKNLAEAIYAAIDRGADIISMSVGGAPSGRLREAIRAAHDNDMILVAAAGNCVKFVVAPAAYGECIACAAVDHRRQPWCGSSRGEQVDFAAPGVFVYTASPEVTASGVQFPVVPRSGTSFATAMIAGCAALWLHHHGGRGEVSKKIPNGMKVQEAFRAALDRSVQVPAGWDSAKFGRGIVDAEALLKVQLETLAVKSKPRPSAIANMARAFADLSETEFRVRLRGAMGLSDAALDDAVRDFAEPLTTLVFWDDELRGRISKKSESPRRMRAAVTSDARRWRTMLPGAFPRAMQDLLDDYLQSATELTGDPDLATELATNLPPEDTSDETGGQPIA
jgi:hypothetical protein